MLQLSITLIENGYLIQLPPAQQGAPPRVFSYPDLETTIAKSREIFEQFGAQMENAQKAMAEAQRETEEATAS